MKNFGIAIGECGAYCDDLMVVFKFLVMYGA